MEPLGVALVFGAGLASVASPCVLPMLPILVAGTTEESRARPLLVVAGVWASFVAMGAASALFGGALAPVMPILERVTGVLVIAIGLLMLVDVHLFERLSFLQRIRFGGRGAWAGLLLGLSLGLVWIPCVGPILSGVLALVATRGSLAHGVLLLSVYAAGFAVPMLAVAYGSQTLRRRIRSVQRYGTAIRWVSGLLLIGFGIAILWTGLIGLGSGL